MPWIKFRPPLVATDFPGLERAGFRTVGAGNGWLYGLFPAIPDSALQARYNMNSSAATDAAGQLADEAETNYRALREKLRTFDFSTITTLAGAKTVLKDFRDFLVR